MPAQVTTIRTEPSPPGRVFATYLAAAFVRRAVMAGVPAAEARRRYLEFVNRPHAPRDRRVS